MYNCHDSYYFLLNYITCETIIWILLVLKIKVPLVMRYKAHGGGKKGDGKKYKSGNKRLWLENKGRLDNIVHVQEDCELPSRSLMHWCSWSHKQMLQSWINYKKGRIKRIWICSPLTDMAMAIAHLLFLP